MSTPEPVIPVILTITKFEAARRQLGTAIVLWFSDDDPVSVHTLACAAYEIIHILTKKRNPLRQRLLFDNLTVKEDKEIAIALKKPAKFFKHANRDIDETLQFPPLLTELFILTAIVGIHTYGKPLTFAEYAFVACFFTHPPRVLNDQIRKLIADGITTFPTELVEQLRSLGKKEFFRVNEASIRHISQK